MTAADFIKNLKSSEVFHVEAAKLEFALELKRVMERENITRTDLAERLKVSKPMVSKLLRGDANLTIETMVKCCRSVGGSLFIRIVREGCSAKLFELAKTTAPKQKAPNAVRAIRDFVVGERATIQWKVAANDLEHVEESNEAKPVAA